MFAACSGAIGILGWQMCEVCDVAAANKLVCRLLITVYLLTVG